MNKIDLALLKTISKALGDELAQEVVFVGGVTTSIYIENDDEPNTTPTDDVDLIVNITSRLEYEKFEQKIRTRGFKRNLSQPGPLCRFEWGEIIVDFMPLEESILGFSNRWYKSGFESAIKVQADEININVLSFPYFLATKIEAFNSRGKKNELYESKDFEDITVVLDGRNNLMKDLLHLPEDISDFTKNFFHSLLQDESILREGLTANLRDHGFQAARIRAISLIEKFKAFLLN